MGKYFVRDTPLAGLEREMMLPPNFAPPQLQQRHSLRLQSPWSGCGLPELHRPPPPEQTDSGLSPHH